jgi:hypothetical protein
MTRAGGNKATPYATIGIIKRSISLDILTASNSTFFSSPLYFMRMNA